MKKILLFIAVPLASIYLLIPAKKLYEINKWIEFKVAGVKKSSLRVGDKNISFYHGGDSEQMVLLIHDF